MWGTQHSPRPQKKVREIWFKVQRKGWGWQDRRGLLCLTLLVARRRQGLPGTLAPMGLGPPPPRNMPPRTADMGLPWGEHPPQRGPRMGGGGSGPGRAWQEVELSTSVTSDYVTSQAGGRRPGFQLTAGCQVTEKGFTAVAAPGGTTKKWVSMVLVTRDLIEG